MASICSSILSIPSYFIKKLKNNSSSTSYSRVDSLSCLPRVLQYEIHTFLTLEEMARIDRVNTNWLNCTKHTWTRLGEKNDTFPWREAQKKKNPPKWNYLLTSALVAIVFRMRDDPEKDYYNIATKLWAKYQYLMDLFPSFNCYAKKRFLDFIPCSATYPTSLGEKLQKERWEIFEEAIQPTATSDALLHVLIEIGERQFDLQPPAFLNQLFLLTEKAIENGVTCTSFLVVTQKMTCFSSDMLERIAVASSKKGDYRALDAVITTYSLEQLQRLQNENSGLVLPPVLHRIALHERDWTMKDTALTTAIEAYGKKVSLEGLNSAAFVKLHLAQYEKADELYTQLIKTYKKYEDTAPVTILAHMALTKSRLEQYKEAEELYKQVLPRWGEYTPIQVLADAAYVKFKLSQLVLADVAHIELQISLLREANTLYEKAIAKFMEAGEMISLSILTHAAFVNLLLRKYKEADLLYTQIVAKYREMNEAVPSFISNHAAQAKLEALRVPEAA